MIRFQLQPSQDRSSSCNIPHIPRLFPAQQQFHSLMLSACVSFPLHLSCCVVFSTPIALSTALYIRRAIRPLMQQSTPCIPFALLCLSKAGVFFFFTCITAQVSTQQLLKRKFTLFTLYCSCHFALQMIWEAIWGVDRFNDILPYCWGGEDRWLQTEVLLTVQLSVVV